MNGFPLVILGVALFALAYVLWRIQGRINDVIRAVDQGFAAIENGVTKNVLDPNGTFAGVVKAVDTSFTTMENGVSQAMLGQGGVLSVTTGALGNARDLFHQAGNDIHDARILLAQDVRTIVTDSATILDDVGNPLLDVGGWLVGIGNDIDIDIAGDHPLAGIAQPFKDIGNDVDAVGNKCLEAENGLNQLSVKMLDAAQQLDALRTGADNIGDQFDGLSKYMDTTFRSDVGDAVTKLGQARTSLDQFFSAFQSGVGASVQELENARKFLDGELLLLVNNRLTAALAVVGVVLIVTGVSIGL
ncbi:MAG TPA: hypothetical protein VEI51_01220 [Methanomicrobiales archaeon]|nr:hypothetical protein [Methanomicrobiales archaeon]